MYPITVIDDFIPDNMAAEIAAVVGDHKFPWYWRPSTKHGIKPGHEQSEDFQFIHLVYHEQAAQSSLFEGTKYLLGQFQQHTGIVIKDILKIKVNLLTRQPVSEAGLSESIHVDREESNYLTVIYYVDDSDGDTIIFNADGTVAQRVTPKRGRAVYFPSNLKHRATPPMIAKRRMVFNMILELPVS